MALGDPEVEEREGNGVRPQWNLVVQGLGPM